MFKYVRTINSHISAPEVFNITALYQTKIYEGALYTTDSGGHLSADLTDSCPKYIALENKTLSEFTRPIRCIKVLPGMVFETQYSSNPDELNVGMHGTWGFGFNNEACYFTSDGNTMEVVSHHYTEDEATIQVTFIN